MDAGKYLRRCASSVEAALPRFARNSVHAHPRLAKAMLYSLSAGGKRLRPALLTAAYELGGGRASDVRPAACALEMVHTYSLIHDDLPCMDNADLRRGRPSCHKAHGEATALLAGDALLTDAFSVLLNSRYPSRVKPAALARAAGLLALRAGAAGMVSGQSADLEAEGLLRGRKVTPAFRRAALKRLEYIHQHKTADLIAGAVEMGAALSGAAPAAFRALAAFGRDLGLCFQIADDILDAEGDKAKLGKTGGDAERGKLTYATLLGVPEARRRAEALLASALRSLGRVPGKAAPKARLAAIAAFVYGRDR